jgi:hypothetical protein
MPHTFLAVSGMIQPDLLAAFRGDVGRESAGNDGWADRFLLSFPDPPDAQGENWKTVSEELEAGYAEVFETLLAREMMPVTDDEGDVVAHRPYYVPFDGSAEEVWEEFTWDVAHRMNQLGKYDSYRGVLSKSKHHMIRLTALVHALRCACGEVSLESPIVGETARRAVTLIGYFEAHGRRCLGVGWLDQSCRVARRLLDWLSRNPAMTSFTRSDTYIQLKDGKDVRKSELLDAPFRLLVDLNYLRPLNTTALRSGPVASAYEVNPAWDRNTRNPVPKVPNIGPRLERQPFNIRDFREGFSENSARTHSADPPVTSSATSQPVPAVSTEPSPGPSPPEPTVPDADYPFEEVL